MKTEQEIREKIKEIGNIQLQPNNFHYGYDLALLKCALEWVLDEIEE